MKKNYIAILLICVIFISGCVQTSDNTDSEDAPTTPQQTFSDTGLRSSNAKYIGNFVALSSEQNIDARFSLYDEDKNYVSGDGIGNIIIVNSDEEIVYKSTINVKKEDFGTYTLILTQDKFIAFAWEIPINQINKSTSSTGTIYLKFIMEDIEFEVIDASFWGLPKYSEQELAQLNDDKFTQSAIVFNNKISKGNFEVTLTKVGFFTPLVTYGDKKEYFRIDMEVKNIGNEQQYFSPSALALLDNQGNQYEKEYGGTLNTYSMYYPGVKKSGYIIFGNVPETLQSAKLVFQLGYDANYDYYKFEYSIPLTK